MNRDPENGPDAAPTPDHDPDATQAWVPSVDADATQAWTPNFDEDATQAWTPNFDEDATQAWTPNFDEDATQAWTPNFEDDAPLSPVEPEGRDWSAMSLLPVAEVTAPVEQVTSPESAGKPDEPSAIDVLFAEDRFEEVPEDEQPLLPLPPLPRILGGESASAEGAPVTPPARQLSDAQRTRILIGAAAGVFTLLVAVAMFLLGTRIPGMASASPQVNVTAAPATTPEGPVEPGTYPWTELRGGECLEPYSDPWAEEFTVVACTDPHTAQLTLHGSYAVALDYRDEDGTLLTPAFPGVEQLAAGIDALCAVALDFEAARDITDGVMQGTFPTTFEEWQADPAYSCFFSRASGASLTGSVAPAAESASTSSDD